MLSADAGAPQGVRHRGFLLLNLLLLPLGCVLLAQWLRHSGWDDRISALFFDAATQRFPARNSLALELWGHRIAKSVMLGVWAMLLAATLAAPWLPRLRPHRRLLWTTTLAMALGPGLVAFVKDINTHACPWDLKAFGGSADYSARWFVSRVDAGRCFPGGHAAGGFSLVALVFAFQVLGQTRRMWLTLALTLLLGTAFGAVRTVQGAHFVSHSLWSAAVDWWVAGVFFLPLLLARPTRASAASDSPVSAPPPAPAMLPKPRATASRPTPRPQGWPIEALVLVVVSLLVLGANTPFWTSALAGRSLAAPATWGFIASAFVLLVAIHAVPTLLLATRRSVRPLLLVLMLCALVGQHMMQRYGVVLDPSMLRNALRTDAREAAELFNPGLLLSIGVALAGGIALWWVPLRERSLRRALGIRAATLAGLLAVAVLALLAGFQDLSSMMRNDKALRYRITPANILYSAGRVVAGDVRNARAEREPLPPIERAATLPGSKPKLLVVMVGETARAMNFSLNGYARVTNPRLATEPIINFPDTTACGTSTEVSLPCMFSARGRADYDEDKIRRSESLPQLLARAGLQVTWLDNQSGCKGLCAGITSRDLTSLPDPQLCPDGRCFDGILLKGLAETVQAQEATGGAKDTVVFLHQLGNHGPAYYKRYPAEFRRFTPECNQNELRECEAAQIVNAYDNAILYTDHLLAETIGWLRSRQDRYDVGLIYASDHGESLGEKGLFLHGMPRAIAPREQLAVPMLWWLGGDGVQGWEGLKADCLRQRAQAPASHDNLYHSILGLLHIQSPARVPERDLVSACR